MAIELTEGAREAIQRLKELASDVKLDEMLRVFERIEKELGSGRIIVDVLLRGIQAVQYGLRNTKKALDELEG